MSDREHGMPGFTASAESRIPTWDAASPAQSANPERTAQPSGGASPSNGNGAQTMLGKGLDIGTANIVAAIQGEDGEITFRLERNAFLDIQADLYSKSMLTKLQVPYVVHGDRLVVIGEAAFELANIFARETRRPMKDGLISPSDVDALPMIRLIIEKVLGKPRQAGENAFFCIPAESVDKDNNVVYHKGLFEGMLRKMGYTPRTIVEGHAVVFGELAEKDFTGIGISFGGGMVNVCVAYKTIPALTFSVARSGDWIDKNVAEVLGVQRTRATMIKERGCNLVAPKNREEEAVNIYYRNLISYVLTNIKNRFDADARNMPAFPEPVEIVCAGGTSMVGGFIDVFKDEFAKIKFPIPVSDIRMAAEPLNAVAKGCLIAAAITE